MAARKVQVSEIANGVADLLKAIGATSAISRSEAHNRGYYSVLDFAKHAGFSQSQSLRLVKNGYESGMLDRVLVAEGRARSYYYRSKK